MLPFGRLLSQSLATIAGAQIGNAGDPIAPPGGRGAQVGDLAIWMLATPPSSGWTLISNTLSIYTKLLTAADLNINSSPSKAWVLLVYRDATSAATRPETGFTKSTAHMGVVAISYQGVVGLPRLTTPPDAILRFSGSSSPTISGYDITAPLGPYPDGAALTPGAGSWTIIELLRI